MPPTTIAFLVPVKRFARAKSRLVPLFPEQARPVIQERIGMALFKDMLATLVEFKQKENRFNARVVVIACGSDPCVGTWMQALGHDFHWIDERMVKGHEDRDATLEWLDVVISTMNEHAMRAFSADGTIVLMADLPLLTSRDLEGLFKRFRSRNELLRKIVLSPSLGNGCNLIARFPPDIIDTCYANKQEPSFLVHLHEGKRQAREMGVNEQDLVEIYKNLEIYLDLDTPDDLMNMYPMLIEFKPDGHLIRLLSCMDVRIAKSSPNDTRQVRIDVQYNGDPSRQP